MAAMHTKPSMSVLHVAVKCCGQHLFDSPIKCYGGNGVCYDRNVGVTFGLGVIIRSFSSRLEPVRRESPAILFYRLSYIGLVKEVIAWKWRLCVNAVYSVNDKPSNVIFHTCV